jgi:hypothetical protein
VFEGLKSLTVVCEEAQITSKLFRNDKFRTRERDLLLVNVSKERGADIFAEKWA